MFRIIQMSLSESNVAIHLVPLLFYLNERKRIIKE